MRARPAASNNCVRGTACEAARGERGSGAPRTARWHLMGAAPSMDADRTEKEERRKVLKRSEYQTQHSVGRGDVADALLSDLGSDAGGTSVTESPIYRIHRF